MLRNCRMDMQQVQVKTQSNRSKRAVRMAHRARHASSAIRAPLRRAPAGLRALLVLGLLLAALLGQSVAVQSHLHMAGRTAWVAPMGADGGTRHGLSTQHAPANTPADCPLCRELAMAGHYITPGPLAFLGGQAPLPWLFVLPVAALLCRSRSHRWQSRAPPR